MNYQEWFIVININLFSQHWKPEIPQEEGKEEEDG